MNDEHKASQNLDVIYRTNNADLNGIWQLLCMSNNEFIPPLSYRETSRDYTRTLVTSVVR